MDPGKLEYYEFLDLSDIDENEKRRLKQALYSDSTPDFLQLPWAPNVCEDNWQNELLYHDDEMHACMANGPLEPMPEARMAQHFPAVSIYSQPPPPNAACYTVPAPLPPTSGYQHPPNVFVSNVTANVNVHGYVPGHYMSQPPHFSLAEHQHQDLSGGRGIGSTNGGGHRGRSRGRGNKRGDIRLEPAPLVETTAAPTGFSPQYVSYYPTAAAYYTSPMQHPNAQQATGSPLYIAPVYPSMYNPYHPAGPHYYPAPPPPGPPAHISPILDEANVEMMYDQRLQDENMDYESPSQTQVQLQQQQEPELLVPYVEMQSIPIPIIPTSTITTTIPTAPVIPAAPIPSIDTVEVKLSVTNENNFIVKTNTNVNTVLVPEPVVVNESVNDTVPPQTEITSVVKVEVTNSVVNAEIEPSPVKVSETVPVPVSAKVPVVTPPSTKSWASLFNNSSSNTPTVTPSSSSHSSNAADNGVKSVAKPLMLVSPFSKATTNDKQSKNSKSAAEMKSVFQSKAYSSDPNSYRMGEFLIKYALDNRIVSLQPRGLANRSNYCYINSILQALLACPPFYNLLKALPYQPRKNSTTTSGSKSQTPIIDSMVEFINEFVPLSAESRLNRKEKTQRKDNNVDVVCGASFEPSRIYKILNGIRTDTFIVEGRQEDAEEFFGCLLNGLNDEMLELIKLVEQGENHQSLSNGDITTNGDTHEQDEVEWKVMGPKNKGSVTRRADFGRTPISDIFRGQLRSRVHRAGDQITDNVQPFFTLQLDIEKPSNVYEALEMLVNKDKLEGVTCSRTNQQVEAWQQVTIEELPLVMVLHLKCFNYKLDTCSKISKALEFPIDLKIDAKLLSSKAKYIGKQKQYKLFAVVYHDGKEATKGHYLTDTYHAGYGSWVRYDDSAVKSVQENIVLHPNGTRVPYLLFYRRSDTIGAQPQQQQQPSPQQQQQQQTVSKHVP